MPTSLRAILGGGGFIKPAAGQSASNENGIGSLEISQIPLGVNYSTIFSATGKFVLLRAFLLGNGLRDVITEITIDGRLLYSGVNTGESIYRSLSQQDLNPPLLIENAITIKARRPSGNGTCTLKLCLIKQED